MIGYQISTCILQTKIKVWSLDYLRCIVQINMFKGSPISKALTRMKIYLYTQNGNFVKETDNSGYIVV